MRIACAGFVIPCVRPGVVIVRVLAVASCVSARAGRTSLANRLTDAPVVVRDFCGFFSSRVAGDRKVAEVRIRDMFVIGAGAGVDFNAANDKEGRNDAGVVPTKVRGNGPPVRIWTTFVSCVTLYEPRYQITPLEGKPET